MSESSWPEYNFGWMCFGQDWLVEGPRGQRHMVALSRRDTHAYFWGGPPVMMVGIATRKFDCANQSRERLSGGLVQARWARASKGGTEKHATCFATRDRGQVLQEEHANNALLLGTVQGQGTVSRRTRTGGVVENTVFELS